MKDATFYSPSDVSKALGVSTSTIKRWVDEGVLPARKTPGGHRKLLRADVLRLVRQGDFPCLDLGRLGLPARLEKTDPEILSQRLLDSLRAGDVSLTRSIIHGAYAAGFALETLGDEVIAPAMGQMGHEWESGHIDVLHEHRGTLLCMAVLHELRPALETNAEKNRPVATGGNPQGDHSVLASLLIQMVLLDAGWDAVNLGPNTPVASLSLAVSELKPRLIWLSVNYLPDPQTFLSEYREFYHHAVQADVAVAVGGQALEDPGLGLVPATCHGTCLKDLAVFAQTLNPRRSNTQSR